MERREPLTHPLSIAGWVLLVMFTGVWLLAAWPWSLLGFYMLIGSVLHAVLGIGYWNSPNYAAMILAPALFMLLPAAIVTAGSYLLLGRRPRWPLTVVGTLALCAGSLVIPPVVWPVLS